jgi:hypothetical protein
LCASFEERDKLTCSHRNTIKGAPQTGTEHGDMAY